MREIRTARTLGLKDALESASPYPRTSPIHATSGPAGEWAAQPVRGTGEQEHSNESAQEDATAEWLAHVEVGRIG